MPWLLWNYDKQSWPDKELVIVDSSAKPARFPKRADVRVLHAPGLNVPQLRNLALREARGEAISWFDDDDWKHPRFLEMLHDLKTAEQQTVAGQRYAWFVSLDGLRANRFRNAHGVLFAGMLADSDAARAIPFDERQERGSDLDWREAILAQGYAETFEAYTFFLCHDRNMGNVAAAHVFSRDIVDVMETVGRQGWGDTTEQLIALQKRIGG